MRYKKLAVTIGIVLVSAGLSRSAASAADAQADSSAAALKVGTIFGAAGECNFIPEARVHAGVAKFADLLTAYRAEQPDGAAVFDSYNKGVAAGQDAIKTKKYNCAFTETDLANLEHQTTPWLPIPAKAAAEQPQAAKPADTASAIPAPSPAPAPSAAPSPVPAPTPAPAPVVDVPAAAGPVLPVAAVPSAPVAASPPPATAVAATSVPATIATVTPPAAPSVPAAATSKAGVQGVTDQEIRFGFVGPISGPSKAVGAQLKLGTQLAFNVANDAGGVHGRKLALFTADDGYDPARTLDAMKQLYETDRVFGFVANFGTATAAVSLPYALSHRALFFGAFTGAALVRRNPPDRYVFNYRPSYAEETAAVVQYLVKIRRLRPEQIAVLTQQDGFGDAGYDGVTKAVRLLRPTGESAAILRLTYPRNTLELDPAVAQLALYQKQHAQAPIRAVVMAAVYRPAAKFIEKTHDLLPGLIYTNVSAVGSTALAEELNALGTKFANGVIVTQVVPAVDSYASSVLDYKAALEKHFHAEAPDYVSLEAFLQANILIEGLRRAGPQLDTEKVVAALEALQNFDLRLGTRVNLSGDDHQAIHKVWGTQLDAAGHYQPLELE